MTTTTGDVRATVEEASRYLECLYRHVDPHEVRSAVHDAWLRLSAAGRPLTVGWVMQEGKCLLRKRLYLAARRERRRVPMPAEVPGQDRASGPEYPAVRAAISELTDSQREAVFRFLGGEGARTTDLVRQWDGAKMRIASRVGPDGGVRVRQTVSLSAVARAAGVSWDSLRRRVLKGMTVEQAITDLKGG